jgi:hypothetical protein
MPRMCRMCDATSFCRVVRCTPSQDRLNKTACFTHCDPCDTCAIVSLICVRCLLHHVAVDVTFPAPPPTVHRPPPWSHWTREKNACNACRMPGSGCRRQGPSMHQTPTGWSGHARRIPIAATHVCCLTRRDWGYLCMRTTCSPPPLGHKNNPGTMRVPTYKGGHCSPRLWDYRCKVSITVETWI